MRCCVRPRWNESSSKRHEKPIPICVFVFGFIIKSLNKYDESSTKCLEKRLVILFVYQNIELNALQKQNISKETHIVGRNEDHEALS